MKRYAVHIDFEYDGQVNVQAEGVPHPLGIYNQTGYDVGRLLREALDAIMTDRNAEIPF